MKFCDSHWERMKALIRKDEELEAMVSSSGEEVVAKEVQNLETMAHTLESYDPLMAMHWGITNAVLDKAGLALFNMDNPHEEEGHWCPVCYVTEFCPCPEENCGEPYIEWAFDHVQEDVANLKAEQN